jgi:hypothetical protein
VADVERHRQPGLEVDEIDGVLGERFLAAYLESSGLGALPALPVYEAFAELRRAMTLWRKRPAGWQDGFAHGLQRAAARLAATAEETTRTERGIIARAAVDGRRAEENR